MDFHDRLVQRAQEMVAYDVRVRHNGRRPHLTGAVDGVHFMLGLHVRPKDIPENYFNSVRDLKRVIDRIRARTRTAAA